MYRQRCWTQLPGSKCDFNCRIIKLRDGQSFSGRMQRLTFTAPGLAACSESYIKSIDPTAGINYKQSDLVQTG